MPIVRPQGQLLHRSRRWNSWVFLRIAAKPRSSLQLESPPLGHNETIFFVTADQRSRPAFRLVSPGTGIMTAQSTAPQPAAAVPLTLHRAPLPALTGVRFLAATQVVLYHFGSGFAQRHHLPRPLTNLLTNGWTAVTLFFILSGFILSYTYSGQIAGRGGKLRFWEARFARIYPVYLLALLLSWPFRGDPGLGLSMAVLTMVQAWNPFHVNYGGAWNSPAWTLSTEAFFYLLFPFFFRCSRSARSGH